MIKGFHGAFTDLETSILVEINLLKRLRDNAKPVRGIKDAYGAKVFKLLNGEIEALESDLDKLDSMAARHRKFDIALEKANAEMG